MLDCSMADAGQVRLGEARGRWVLVVTVLTSAVALLDSTVVNVALPAVGRDLDAGFAGLQWTVDGYTLTLAALLLLGGALGDRYGRRRLLLCGVAVFGVASAACAAAPGIELLVTARLAQGVGAALLTPASLAVISASFPGEDRGRAIGLWSAFGALAGALGPFAGGLLVPVSWRLVFLVNVPLCAAVLLLGPRHVPESRDEQAQGRLDLPGAALAVLGLGALTSGLVRLGEDGGRAVDLALALLGAALLVAFVVVERRARHPLLPVAVLADRQSAAGNAVTFLVYAALGGVFFLLVVHLQVSAGYAPLLAGSALLPVTGCMLLLSGPAGALAARTGPRLPMTAGPLGCAAGTLLLLRAGTDARYLQDVLPAVTVFGLGLATTVAPLTSAVLAAAPARYAGVASAVNNAVARTGQLLAVAVLPVVAGLTGTAGTDPERFAAGFRTAMLVAAALLGAGGLLAGATVRRPSG